MANIYDYEARDISGEPVSMSEYEGKPLLIVNTASKCGFTPQYTGLEEIHKKFEGDGLVVLGFPCNQFGGQEPGSEEDIQTFCQKNYGVSFRMFSKVDVKGSDAHPIFEYLTGESSGAPGDVQWNFEKFLVDRNGKLSKRFSSRIKPEGDQMAAAIKEVL